MTAITRLLLTLALLSDCGCVTVAMAAASAEDDQSAGTVKAPAETRDVKPGLLREKSYKRLLSLYEMIEEKRYEEAFSGLQVLFDQNESFPYERAVVAQAMGHVRVAQDRLVDALSFFKAAVELNVLPNAQQYRAIYDIAQFYAFMGRHRSAIKWADRWFATTDEVTPQSYVLLANSHAQLSQYRPAIAGFRRAIELSRERSEEPSENWYVRLMALHFELKEYAQSAEILALLVKKHPEKRVYWTQLSSMYMILKKDRKALAVLDKAYRSGLFEKQSDWIQLWELYGFLGIPYKAALILQDGLERGAVESTRGHWEKLADAWRSAGETEKAVAADEMALGSAQ